MNNIYIQQHTSRGAALLLFVLFFMFGSAALSYLISKSIYSDLVSYQLLEESKISYMTAEASLEDTAYRYSDPALSVDEEEVLVINGVTATTTTDSSVPNEKTLLAVGNRNGAIRKVSLVLGVVSGGSFSFGVQTGTGGFRLQGSSQVVGSVFSSGPIIATSYNPGTPHTTKDVVSAGPNGYVEKLHASGTVRAHEIDSGVIRGDAYYQVIDLGDTTVLGTTYPGSVDEEPVELPFTDADIDARTATITAEIDAGNGTLIASTSAECLAAPYIISVDTTFSNPTKIECDVEINADVTLTLVNNLWVTGSLTLKKPIIETAPVDPDDDIFVIVDDPLDSINSSWIDVQNGTTFSTTTNPGSYVLLISMNDDAENGGHADPNNARNAITMSQSSNGAVILYSAHGKIAIANSVSLKEVTGYLISMGNNSTVIYESGLLDISSPGDGAAFGIFSWNETD